MYLVICKNKHGLSVEGHRDCKADAEILSDMCYNIGIEGNTYHVRKFDLASIDLEKLMEEDNA